VRTISLFSLAACGDDDKVVGAGNDRALSIVQDGNTYVNLTGRMTFNGVPADASLQFCVDTDAGTFEMNAFEINDIPQSDAMKLTLIEVMYGDDGCG
jgi:hypothetical protein